MDPHPCENSYFTCMTSLLCDIKDKGGTVAFPLQSHMNNKETTGIVTVPVEIKQMNYF